MNPRKSNHFVFVIFVCVFAAIFAAVGKSKKEAGYYRMKSNIQAPIESPAIDTSKPIEDKKVHKSKSSKRKDNDVEYPKVKTGIYKHENPAPVEKRVARPTEIVLIHVERTMGIHCIVDPEEDVTILVQAAKKCT